MRPRSRGYVLDWLWSIEKNGPMQGYSWYLKAFSPKLNTHPANSCRGDDLLIYYAALKRKRDAKAK
jgi:hypothetical protein